MYNHNTRKEKNMEKTRFFALILIIVFISFCGFIVENISTSISDHKIDNRNMTLPFLLGYGLAILVIFELFGTPNNPLFWGKEIIINSSFLSFLYYFIITFLCVTVGELILGHFIELTCQIKWWNYSALPLHITQYTSIPTSTVFALLITLFMKYIFSPMLNLFSKINPPFLAILSVSLIIILSIDFIHSGIYMFTHHTILKIWHIEF